MKLYDLFKQHPVICTDTRNCTQNALFFALKGERFDANTFARDALEQGCAFAVIDNPAYATDERFILVDDVLQTLQQLAEHHRRQLNIPLIGITGTNGKTTTKELIAAVLAQKFNVHYTKGNLNNHIGVPLTLLGIKPEHQIAVVEMGANHPGEIKTLANIAHPNYGIVTNVGMAHLQGFGSLQGVMRTKAELYQAVHRQGGTIFLNTDNQHLLAMAEKAGFRPDDDNTVTYNTHNNTRNNPKNNKTAASGKIIHNNPMLAMQCRTAGKPFDVQTQLIGQYNAENILAAIAIGTHFGIDDQLIKRAIENYKPTNNRSQLMVTKLNQLILDTYNANPTSMKAAIEHFAAIQTDKPKTIILGDMLELGNHADDEHQKIIDLINEKSFSNVYLVGNHFRKTKNNFRTYTDVAQLKAAIQTQKPKNHLVLIKGSRGIRLEEITENL